MPFRSALVTAAVALLLAGCTTDAEQPDGSDEPWRLSADPVETGGLVWASGSTVHLADGTTIDTGAPIGGYVVAGDGVWFAEADGDDYQLGNDAEAELRFAAPDGEVVDTGITFLGESLAASAGGRYLALIDVRSGEEDDFGTPQATVRVLDLRTGEEVVQSTEGMGDPADDDFAAVYPEAEMDVRALTDEAAYVDTLEGTLAFDLATGEARAVSDDEVPDPGLDPTTSPDGAWQIVDGPRRTDLLAHEDGRRVRPRPGTPRWDLDRWVDDTTVVGVAISGPGLGEQIDPRDSLALMSCVVPTGACVVHEETSGREVLFPHGSSEVVAMTLQAGGA